MSIEQTFCIDILNLVPDNSDLYVQAPSLESSKFLQLTELSDIQCYRHLTLTSQNRQQLIELIQLENIEPLFQSIEIKFDNKCLIECHDGMEIGIASRLLKLKQDFKKKYTDLGMLLISTEW